MQYYLVENYVKGNWIEINDLIDIIKITNKFHKSTEMRFCKRFFSAHFLLIWITNWRVEVDYKSYITYTQDIIFLLLLERKMVA